MTFRFTKFICLSAIALNSSLALAAEWNIDAAHSNVMFTVRHLVSRINGQFKDFSGAFSFDEKKMDDSKVSFKIKTNSIDTTIGKRDDHLRSPDFFDSTKFPDMTFESTKVTSKGSNTLLIDGKMSLHGITKPVVFETEFLGLEKGPDGVRRAGFAAKTKINRKDFGLTWNKLVESGAMLVGEEVDISIQIEAIEKK